MVALMVLIIICFFSEFLLGGTCFSCSSTPVTSSGMLGEVWDTDLMHPYPFCLKKWLLPDMFFSGVQIKKELSKVASFCPVSVPIMTQAGVSEAFIVFAASQSAEIGSSRQFIMSSFSVELSPQGLPPHSRSLPDSCLTPPPKAPTAPVLGSYQAQPLLLLQDVRVELQGFFLFVFGNL